MYYVNTRVCVGMFKYVWKFAYEHARQAIFDAIGGVPDDSVVRPLGIVNWQQKWSLLEKKAANWAVAIAMEVS